MPLTNRGEELVASGNRNPVWPKTESDQTFKIAVARELMFAWEDAPIEVKPHLERVMCNVGIYQTPAPSPDHIGAWMIQLRPDHEFFVGKIKQ